MKWRVLDSKYVVRRPWLTARCDTVELPDGVINKEYYVLEYPDWVNTIAITADGHYVFVRQYRHGLGRTLFELCAGVMEKGELPEQAARRELMEETGFGGGTWHEAMSICANASTTNNITHCFVAEGVEKRGGQHLDRTEDVEIHVLTRDEVWKLLSTGQIVQATMAAPLWKHFYDLVARR